MDNVIAINDLDKFRKRLHKQKIKQVEVDFDTKKAVLGGYIKLFEIYSTALTDKQCQRMRND